MKLPLLDLGRQYELIKNEIEPAVLKVLSSSQYIMGEEVERFETEIACYLDCRNAISCANGTDALILALRSLGIGNGDEVITTPFTFFASAEAISRVGAVPVFADVISDTYNMDPSKIESKITRKTKAILSVHIFGQPAQMDEIMCIAQKHDLFVIEDACQAMGAAYKGKKAGTIGDIGCFSFFPTKNLACFGDGGLIVTNNEKISKIIKALRVHGGGKAGEEAYNLLKGTQNNEALDAASLSGMDKYYNYLIGYNSRLDEIQAAVLRVKLRYLDAWNLRRQELAARYNKAFDGLTLALQHTIPGAENIYHQYVILSEKRDELCSCLKSKGVSTGMYYPVPLHLQKAYASLFYKEGDMPVSEYLSKRSLALPIYPELTEQEQDYIITCILEFGKN